jgi:methyl-accepting chemotaxis protein
MGFFSFGTRTSPEAARHAENAALVAAIYKTRAVIEFTLEGTIITANPLFLQAMGYSLPEITGKRHSMFVDPDYATSVSYKEFWRRLNAGDSFTAKFARQAKGGRAVWIQASYVPILGPDGKPNKVVKFADDITAIEEAAARMEADRAAAAAEASAVVEALSTSLGNLAAGDLETRLSAPFPAAYERLRADFNTAIERLGSAMARIAGGAASIRQAAADVAEVSDDLARRTQEQAGTVQNALGAMQQITTVLRQTTEGATKAGTVLISARQDAAGSREVLDQTVTAMTAIEGSAREIGSIIGLIDEIAFQTNLLALNAGVEAARAGDAGRGFAVVATEVRALAQRSADAAKQIKTLISASGAQVGEGVRLVHATGEALQRIAGQVSALDGVVSQITKAAGAQESVIGSIQTAMQGLDKTTQHNAAIVSQGAGTAQELAQQADGLEGMVGQFKTGVAPATVVRMPPPRVVSPRPGPGKFIRIQK